MTEKSKSKINIKMPNDLEPKYSNGVKISHTDDEFTLSFFHKFTGSKKATMKSIVTVTPSHVKRLSKALQTSIEKYEKKYGEIGLPEEKDSSPSNVEVR